jgi:hypothetical protein
LVNVAIRARDHDFEAGTELALVGSAIGSDGCTVISTFYPRDRRRVGAGSTWFEARISLKIDVNRATPYDLVAAIGTLDRVVLRQRGKAKVSIRP